MGCIIREEQRVKSRAESFPFFLGVLVGASLAALTCTEPLGLAWLGRLRPLAPVVSYPLRLIVRAAVYLLSCCAWMCAWRHPVQRELAHSANVRGRRQFY